VLKGLLQDFLVSQSDSFC